MVPGWNFDDNNSKQAMYWASYRRGGNGRSD